MFTKSKFKQGQKPQIALWLFEKAKRSLNTLANLDEEKLDSAKVVENELMNMILESY